MKSMLKSQVATCANISLTTFKKWLDACIKENPSEFKNYNKNARILTPRQIKIFCDFYGVEIDF